MSMRVCAPVELAHLGEAAPPLAVPTPRSRSGHAPRVFGPPAHARLMVVIKSPLSEYSGTVEPTLPAKNRHFPTIPYYKTRVVSILARTVAAAHCNTARRSHLLLSLVLFLLSSLAASQASHDVNADSSRSHSIFTIDVNVLSVEGWGDIRSLGASARKQVLLLHPSSFGQNTPRPTAKRS